MISFPAKHTKAQGFTLVELSIVIIIIGFLIAGISSGTSLVAQSKIQALANEMTSIRMALSTFMGVYGYMPADFPNASAYWPDCDTTPSNCNGNGDGYVTSNQFEGVRMWQQLNAAGLFPGNYPGTMAVLFTPVIGVEVPASIWGNGAGYMVANYGAPCDVSQGVCAGAAINFGTGFALADPVMNPVEAYNLEKKIDDGLPRQGFIWAGGGFDSASCYDSPESWYIPSSYNIALTGKLCSLHLLKNDIEEQ